MPILDLMSTKGCFAGDWSSTTPIGLVQPSETPT